MQGLPLRCGGRGCNVDEERTPGTQAWVGGEKVGCVNLREQALRNTALQDSGQHLTFTLTANLCWDLFYGLAAVTNQL